MIVYSLHDFMFQELMKGVKFNGYKFITVNKKGDEEILVAESIKLTSKNISFTIIDKNGKRIPVGFYRVQKILNEKDELMFENSVD